MQLSFAIFPLMKFTSDRRMMGEFANPLWVKIVGYTICTVIAGLNLSLLFQELAAPSGSGPWSRAVWRSSDG
jgi:manganese transport protein